MGANLSPEEKPTMTSLPKQRASGDVLLQNLVLTAQKNQSGLDFTNAFSDFLWDSDKQAEEGFRQWRAEYETLKRRKGKKRRGGGGIPASRHRDRGLWDPGGEGPGRPQTTNTALMRQKQRQGGGDGSGGSSDGGAAAERCGADSDTSEPRRGPGPARAGDSEHRGSTGERPTARSQLRASQETFPMQKAGERLLALPSPARLHFAAFHGLGSAVRARHATRVFPAQRCSPFKQRARSAVMRKASGSRGRGCGVGVAGGDSPGAQTQGSSSSLGCPPRPLRVARRRQELELRALRHRHQPLPLGAWVPPVPPSRDGGDGRGERDPRQSERCGAPGPGQSVESPPLVSAQAVAS